MPDSNITIPWLVWSHEHNAFWRANHQGYTRSIERAGRYTRAEAEAICKNASYGEGRRYANQPDNDTPPNEICFPAPEVGALLHSIVGCLDTGDYGGAVHHAKKAGAR